MLEWCKIQKSHEFIGMISMHPLLNYLLNHLESCQDILIWLEIHKWLEDSGGWCHGKENFSLYRSKGWENGATHHPKCR